MSGYRGQMILGNYIPVCKFCGDRGCLACDGEKQKKEAELKAKRDAEYAAAFPNGPEPIFVARLDNPAEMEQLKRIFGALAITERLDNAGGDMDKFVELTNELAQEAMQERDSGDSQNS